MSDSKQRDERAGDDVLPGEIKESGASRQGSYGGSAADATAEEARAPGAAGGRHSTLGAVGTSAINTVGDIGGDAVGTTRNVLRGAIGATEEVGSNLVGGVAHIATDLVHGVTDLGYEVRDGATGLIGAVGDVGVAAVNTVAHLLVGVVGGVRQVIGAAVVGDHRGRSDVGAAGPEEGFGDENGGGQPARMPRTTGSPAPDRTARY